MQITLAALADAANQSDRGKLNLLGVFHNIGAPNVPCRHPALAVVAVVRLDVDEKDVEHVLRIRLRDADGKVVGETPPVAFLVPREDPRPTPEVNFILEWRDQWFPSFGDYTFEFDIDGRVLRDAPLTITQTPPPITHLSGSGPTE